MYFDTAFVRHARRELGLSQAQFAEKLGVSPSRVQELETTPGPVPAAYLRLVLSKLGLNAQDLAEDLRAFADQLTAVADNGAAPLVRRNNRIQPLVLRTLSSYQKRAMPLSVLVEKIAGVLTPPEFGRDRRADRVRLVVRKLADKGVLVLSADGQHVRYPTEEDLC